MEDIMLKYKLLACLMALSSMHYVASAENISINEDVEQCLEKRCCRGVRELTLKDFAGDWIFEVDTVGGVAGPTAVGTSLTIDGQVTFNSLGIGIVNHAAGVLYSGVVGSVVQFNLTPGVATVTITITDPVFGVGTMLISDPGFSETVDFVVIRSKTSGKVLKFEGHRTSVNAQTSAVGVYSFERQYQ